MVAVSSSVGSKSWRRSHALESRRKMVGGSELLLVCVKGLLSGFILLLPPVSYSSFHKTLFVTVFR